MLASTLTERVEVQHDASAVDGYGARVGGAARSEERWARVEALSSRELEQASQFQGRVTHKVTMRFFRGLTPKHRIRWRDPITGDQHVYQIAAVLHEGPRRNVSTVAMCTEQVSAAVEGRA